MIMRKIVLALLVFFSQLNLYPEENQNYKLNQKFVNGQEWKAKIDSYLDVDIIKKDVGGEFSSISSIVKSTVLSEKIIEAKNGQPSVLEIKCLSSTKNEGESGVVPRGQVKTAIDGKSFILKRNGKKYDVQVTEKDTSISPDELELLANWNFLEKFLPKREVKIGETWEVEINDILHINLGKIIKQNEKFSCTLQGVNDKGEASMLLSGNISGESDKFSQFEIKCDGLIVVDFTNPRFSIKISGNLNFKKEFAEKNNVVGEVSITSRKLELNISSEMINP